VFISYSKRDEPWVIDYLFEPLEVRGYNVCLLHQDGPNYSNTFHYVNNELIGQLKRSQALVINLTKDFLDNEWKALHIRTSHQFFAKENKRLIAIIGADVKKNLDELDVELGQILRHHAHSIIQRDPHMEFQHTLMKNLPRRDSPVASETSQLYSDIYGSVGGVDTLGGSSAIVPSDIV